MVTGEFDVDILKDLINEGYEGQELLEKFIEMREKIPKAMEMMFQDLIEKYKDECCTLEEAFSDEE